MRALVFSDLHDDEAALEALEKAASSFEHVFICGDSAQTEWFAKKVKNSFEKAFIIPGNNEGRNVIKVLERMPNFIHERLVSIENGLKIAGFGYSNPTPFSTYGELSEELILDRLSRIPIDRDTLLLLHAPPKGYFDIVRGDAHAGSSSILKVIKEKQPLAAFFGHVHEHEGIGSLKRTTLVKIPPAFEKKAVSAEIINNKVTARIITV